MRVTIACDLRTHTKSFAVKSQRKRRDTAAEMACAGACRSFRAAKRATASTPGPRRALQPAPSPARRQPRDHATQASHLYAHPAALRMPSASICRSCSATRWPAVQPIPWTHHQSRAHQRAQQRQTRRSLRASVRPAPADTYTLRQGSQADLPVIAQAVLREMCVRSIVSAAAVAYECVTGHRKRRRTAPRVYFASAHAGSTPWVWTPPASQWPQHRTAQER